MLDLTTSLYFLSENRDFLLAYTVNSSDKEGKAFNQVFSDVFTDMHCKC